MAEPTDYEILEQKLTISGLLDSGPKKSVHDTILRVYNVIHKQPPMTANNAVDYRAALHDPEVLSSINDASRTNTILRPISPEELQTNGEWVKQLQETLQRQGRLKPNAAYRDHKVIDNIYGLNTAQAVKVLYEEKKLPLPSLAELHSDLISQSGAFAAPEKAKAVEETPAAEKLTVAEKPIPVKAPALETKPQDTVPLFVKGSEQSALPPSTPKKEGIAETVPPKNPTETITPTYERIVDPNPNPLTNPPVKPTTVKVAPPVQEKKSADDKAVSTPSTSPERIVDVSHPFGNIPDASTTPEKIVVAKPVTVTTVPNTPLAESKIPAPPSGQTTMVVDPAPTKEPERLIVPMHELTAKTFKGLPAPSLTPNLSVKVKPIENAPIPTPPHKPTVGEILRGTIRSFGPDAMQHTFPDAVGMNEPKPEPKSDKKFHIRLLKESPGEKLRRLTGEENPGNVELDHGPLAKAYHDETGGLLRKRTFMGKLFQYPTAGLAIVSATLINGVDQIFTKKENLHRNHPEPLQWQKAEDEKAAAGALKNDKGEAYIDPLTHEYVPLAGQSQVGKSLRNASADTQHFVANLAERLGVYDADHDGKKGKKEAQENAKEWKESELRKAMKEDRVKAGEAHKTEDQRVEPKTDIKGTSTEDGHASTLDKKQLGSLTSDYASSAVLHRDASFDAGQGKRAGVKITSPDEKTLG